MLLWSVLALINVSSRLFPLIFTACSYSSGSLSPSFPLKPSSRRLPASVCDFSLWSEPYFTFSSLKADSFLWTGSRTLSMPPIQPSDQIKLSGTLWSQSSDCLEIPEINWKCIYSCQKDLFEWILIFMISPSDLTLKSCREVDWLWPVHLLVSSSVLWFIK